MSEFFRTVMGHRFFEGHVPKIADALADIAKALPRFVALLEQQTPPRPATTDDVVARRDAEALNEIAEVLRRRGPTEALNRVSLKVVVNRIANVVDKTGRL